MHWNVLGLVFLDRLGAAADLARTGQEAIDRVELREALARPTASGERLGR